MINKTVDNKIMALYKYFDTHPKYTMTHGEMFGLLNLVVTQLSKAINENGNRKK